MSMKGYPNNGWIKAACSSKTARTHLHDKCCIRIVLKQQALVKRSKGLSSFQEHKIKPICNYFIITKRCFSGNIMPPHYVKYKVHSLSHNVKLLISGKHFTSQIVIKAPPDVKLLYKLFPHGLYSNNWSVSQTLSPQTVCQIYFSSSRFALCPHRAWRASNSTCDLAQGRRLALSLSAAAPRSCSGAAVVSTVPHETRWRWQKQLGCSQLSDHCQKKRLYDLADAGVVKWMANITDVQPN